MHKFLPYILLLLLFVSCSGNDQSELKKKANWTRKKSIAVNKSFAHEEKMRIKLYLSRRPNWKMTKTGSGLQYWIYENHDGPTAKKGDKVAVKFKMELLDGTVLYEATDDHLSVFKVDHSEVESGVMEGIKYLSEGDKAKLILPSHIAHGLLGDLHEIPPLVVLVIDMQLVKIY